MKIKTLAAAVCLVAASATASLAATFTVNGVDYDITTRDGTFNSLVELLAEQKWWNDEAAALAFAEATKFSFSAVSLGEGPIFATGSDNGWASGALYSSANPFIDPQAVIVSTPVGGNNTFAIATQISPVPLPAGGLLLLTGFVGFAGLKRRKKKAA